MLEVFGVAAEGDFILKGKLERQSTLQNQQFAADLVVDSDSIDESIRRQVLVHLLFACDIDVQHEFLVCNRQLLLSLLAFDHCPVKNNLKYLEDASILVPLLPGKLRIGIWSHKEAQVEALAVSFDHFSFVRFGKTFVSA